MGTTTAPWIDPSFGSLVMFLLIVGAVYLYKRKKPLPKLSLGTTSAGMAKAGGGNGNIVRNTAIAVAVVVAGWTYYAWTPDPATISAFMWKRIVATIIIAAAAYALARIFLLKDHEKVGIGLAALAVVLVAITILGKNPEMVAYLQGAAPPAQRSSVLRLTTEPQLVSLLGRGVKKTYLLGATSLEICFFPLPDDGNYVYQLSDGRIWNRSTRGATSTATFWSPDENERNFTVFLAKNDAACRAKYNG